MELQLANNKQMKLYKCSRLELFNKLDKPLLKTLPVYSYLYQDYIKARVSGGYHVLVENHYYSVPHNLVKEEVDVWYTVNKVEIYYKNKSIAKHVRSHVLGDKTTTIDHMPIGHRKYQEINATKIKEMAHEVGVATELIVNHIFANSSHEAIACRKCYGFLNLAQKYSSIKLESTCNYAINIGVFNYKNIEILLKNKVIKTDIVSPSHSNIRGSEYYN